MLTNTFIALILGIILGIFTGLAPGIHVNLAAVILFSFSALITAKLGFLGFCVLIISLAITHAMMDFLPSTYLGAPEEATAMSVLPAHRLLLKGRGHEAIQLSVLGGMSGVALTAIACPLLLKLLPAAYAVVKDYTAVVLLFLILLIIAMENGAKKRIWSITVFMLSGILGIVVLSMHDLREPLTPLLTGLFGVGSLLVSLNSEAEIREQRQGHKMILSSAHGIKALLGGLLSGTFVSLFPAVGPAHAAMIASRLLGRFTTRSYLVLISCISTVTTVLGLLTLITIGKARNGPIVVISQAVESLAVPQLGVLLGAALCAAGISALACLKVSRVFSVVFSGLQYKRFCISALLLMCFVSFLVSGFPGLLILAVASSIGVLAAVSGINRSSAMGSLILPVILYSIL